VSAGAAEPSMTRLVAQRRTARALYPSVVKEPQISYFWCGDARCGRVAGHAKCRTNTTEATVAKPLIPAQVILDRALELLDAEGPKALNVRRLSTELKMSPNTLYQQVGNQAALARALIARYFSLLKLDFTEHDTWDATALHWCLGLHDALQKHPYLTELMTIDDRDVVREYVRGLLESALRSGMPRPLALECCRGLANMTFNHSVAVAKARQESTAETRAEIKKIERNFSLLVGWVTAAASAEASHPRWQRQRPAARPRRAAKARRQLSG
jgi:AcrR family transcriptional regulator